MTEVRLLQNPTIIIRIIIIIIRIIIIFFNIKLTNATMCTIAELLRLSKLVATL